ncbi:hypothetical protein [Shewanella ulleungensis]|uniref:Lipoprotein n=1 Tax=Shewanella ulleungensis TaxID=2282699 RepID=A0ABQ2QMA3_9GAMM|nr:hypothetical protein [Shewanella ulleungensis]MCL1149864.1 hypothetical protein [Shewanella ulleungensis]GGP85155.1 hypothetical protein GCM10009410_17910 [Shewanella ulleungensis]
MKKKCIISFSATMLFLVGCASSPPVIEASIPLLDQPIKSIGENVIPSELNSIVSQQPQGYAGVYNDVQFTLGKQYFSALGKQCREVYLNYASNNADKQRRVVCKDNQSVQWSIIPQVIDSKNNQIDFGA